ncbi:hypothetical protein FHG87_014532 [Trinorchestia longiramus]|nr:hypothetical protein FHG87_014532 [Trinorchestia longiramus]
MSRVERHAAKTMRNVWADKGLLVGTVIITSLVDYHQLGRQSPAWSTITSLVDYHQLGRLISLLGDSTFATRKPRRKLAMLLFVVLLSVAAAVARPSTQLRDSDTLQASTIAQKFPHSTKKFDTTVGVEGKNQPIGGHKSVRVLITNLVDLMRKMGKTSENEIVASINSEGETFIFPEKLKLIYPEFSQTHNGELEEANLNEIPKKRSGTEYSFYPIVMSDERQTNPENDKVKSTQENKKSYVAELDLYKNEGIVQQATESLPNGRIINTQAENPIQSSTKVKKMSGEPKIKNMSIADLIKRNQETNLETLQEQNISQETPMASQKSPRAVGGEWRPPGARPGGGLLLRQQGEILQDHKPKLAFITRLFTGRRNANGMRLPSSSAYDKFQQLGTQLFESKDVVLKRSSGSSLISALVKNWPDKYSNLIRLLQENAQLTSETANENTLHENYSSIEKHLKEIINEEKEQPGLGANRVISSPFWDLEEGAKNYEDSLVSFMDDILPENFSLHSAESTQDSRIYKVHVRFLEDATGLKSKIERSKYY